LRKIDDSVVKHMAQLLKNGATMLSETCPICGTPLFRLKTGEIFCPRCNRRVYIVKDEKEEKAVKRSFVMDYLLDALYERLEELTISLQNANTVEELKDYLSILNLILEVLAKANRIVGYEK